MMELFGFCRFEHPCAGCFGSINGFIRIIYEFGSFLPQIWEIGDNFFEKDLSTNQKSPILIHFQCLNLELRNLFCRRLPPVTARGLQRHPQIRKRHQVLYQFSETGTFKLLCQRFVTKHSFVFLLIQLH